MPTQHGGTQPASKRERRESAREQRRAVEARQRRARLLAEARRKLGLVALAALVTVAAMIAIGEATLPKDKAVGAEPPSASVQLYAGIPQNGVAVGNPKAPVTLIEFVDMQCPYCSQFDRTVMPTVIDKYVRPGKVRVELRTLAFIGADSQRAAGAVAGAAAQNKMWPFVDRFFHEQGEENSGYVTEGFLRDVGKAVPGLDMERVLAFDGSAAIARAQQEANAAGINSTPAFVVGKTGGQLSKIELKRLDTNEFTGKLDKELAKR